MLYPSISELNTLHKQYLVKHKMRYVHNLIMQNKIDANAIKIKTRECGTNQLPNIYTKPSEQIQSVSKR